MSNEDNLNVDNVNEDPIDDDHIDDINDEIIPEGKKDDAEFLKDSIKKLMKENAKRRIDKKNILKKNEELQARLDELTTKVKDDVNGAISKTEKLNSSLEKRVINSELSIAAEKAGLIDKDAFKMVDISKIKLSEDGEVLGVNELMEDLRNKKPYLFKSQSSSNQKIDDPNPEKILERPTYKGEKEYAAARARFNAEYS